MDDDASAFDQRVLSALVEGFVARAGAKERFRSLSEYEIARRLGVDTYTYASFEESSERQSVLSALTRLQRRGLAEIASLSGRYATFSPTSAGEDAVAGPPSALPAESAPPLASQERTLADQLDEIIHLLRSIDRRLASGSNGSTPFHDMSSE